MLLPEQQRAPEASANYKEKDYLSGSKPSQIIATTTVTTTATTTKSPTVTLDQYQQYCKLKLSYVFY